MQIYFHDHFLSEGHNELINDVEIFLLIRLIHRTLPEERNSGEIKLTPQRPMVEMWKNSLQVCIVSLSFNFRHFSETAIYNVSK